jgi:hypothetical protein
MILITTYYKTLNENRNNEINKCLIKNFENKYIKKIYLLNDKIYTIDFIDNYQSKIIQVVISNDKNYKLKYNDAIFFINKYLVDEICILSNSDIYFNESLELINDKNIENNFFALLRYDEDENGNLSLFKRYDVPRSDSQDCWIFKSPLKVDLNKLNFSLGTLGCDSVFAYIVNNSGIIVSNPSYDIISIHVHNTEFRTYSYINRIHGKYCMIPICKLNEYKELTIIDY